MNPWASCGTRTCNRERAVRAVSEGVVNRCALKDALLYALALSEFVVLRLKNDAEVFKEEYATENGEQQFLVNDYCKDRNDTADSERASVAHKDLGWESVVPQKTDERSYHGADKDYEFFRVGKIHDVEIACHFKVARYVCKHSQRNADDGGVAGCHSIHPVVEVRTVGNSGNDKHGH